MTSNQRMYLTSAASTSFFSGSSLACRQFQYFKKPTSRKQTFVLWMFDLESLVSSQIREAFCLVLTTSCYIEKQTFIIFDASFFLRVIPHCQFHSSSIRTPQTYFKISCTSAVYFSISLVVYGPYRPIFFLLFSSAFLRAFLFSSKRFVRLQSNLFSKLMSTD